MYFKISLSFIILFQLVLVHGLYRSGNEGSDVDYDSSGGSGNSRQKEQKLFSSADYDSARPSSGNRQSYTRNNGKPLAGASDADYDTGKPSNRQSSSRNRGKPMAAASDADYDTGKPSNRQSSSRNRGKPLAGASDADYDTGKPSNRQQYTRNNGKPMAGASDADYDTGKHSNRQSYTRNNGVKPHAGPFEDYDTGKYRFSGGGGSNKKNFEPEDDDANYDSGNKQNDANYDSPGSGNGQKQRLNYVPHESCKSLYLFTSKPSYPYYLTPDASCEIPVCYYPQEDPAHTGEPVIFKVRSKETDNQVCGRSGRCQNHKCVGDSPWSNSELNQICAEIVPNGEANLYHDLYEYSPVNADKSCIQIGCTTMEKKDSWHKVVDVKRGNGAPCGKGGHCNGNDCVGQEKGRKISSFQ